LPVPLLYSLAALSNFALFSPDSNQPALDNLNRWPVRALHDDGHPFMTNWTGLPKNCAPGPPIPRRAGSLLRLKDNLDQIMANLQDGLMLFTRDSSHRLGEPSVERFVVAHGAKCSAAMSVKSFRLTRLGRLILDSFRLRRESQGEVEGENGKRMQVSLDFIHEHGEQMAPAGQFGRRIVRRIEDEIELSAGFCIGR